jgi:membrane-bound serine protease (ClpP class)
MVGRVGVAKSDISPFGSVQVGGELWSAELDQDQEIIKMGSRVRVTKVQGVRLTVQKY